MILKGLQRDPKMTPKFLTECDPEAVVLSIDGIGAFDHVRRAAMLEKLASTPSLRPLAPLVRQLYGRQSCFFWTDDDGTTHEILQGEGGEQGGLRLCPTRFVHAVKVGLDGLGDGLGVGHWQVSRQW